MKYSIKPKNDSDKENAKQLELIMNNKFETYDDISEIRKELVDNFEFKIPCIIDGHEELISKTESEIINFDQIVNDEISKQILESGLHKSIESLMEFDIAAEHISYDRGICIQSINPMDMRVATPASFSINRNPFYPRSYESRDTVEIIDAILFKKDKQPKENHPHGWYRKFDKKRY